MTMKEKSCDPPTFPVVPLAGQSIQHLLGGLAQKVGADTHGSQSIFPFLLCEPLTFSPAPPAG